MTGEEIKDELYRMLSDVLNGNGPIRNNAQRGRYREVVKSAIEAVEQKPNKWIPVSEDLPKDAYGCIVTVLYVDLRTQNEFENILPYFVGYDGETWNNAGGEPIPYEVIAWMKAPEPYNAESEDKNSK